MTDPYYYNTQKKKEKEEREKQLKTGARFEGKKKSPGQDIQLPLIAVWLCAVFACLPTLFMSFVFAFFITIILVIYYYGIKKHYVYDRIINNINVKCSHCHNTFKGVQDNCPHCGNSISVDTNFYSCENCKHLFMSKRDNCPQCEVGLYYKS